MSDIKKSDIFQLALKGYKLSEIQELVELSKQVEDEVKIKSDDTPEVIESAKEAPGECGDHSEDLNNEILDLKKQLDESRALIASLQEANINKDNSGQQPKTEDELLADIGKLFI